jgi:hypothetical protein
MSKILAVYKWIPAFAGMTIIKISIKTALTPSFDKLRTGFTKEGRVLTRTFSNPA